MNLAKNNKVKKMKVLYYIKTKIFCIVIDIFSSEMFCEPFSFLFSTYIYCILVD